ncbi:HSP20-like chaperone [Laetiporus sulphureus 93-53]|uniref:HSP20-like chaperone n=1 Tax=Laetiporus sulphureus 93-53 TaxID=1314785 RepID=A0A165CB33_9APHY|nr:HSP20-like chaperone [Laetiporus sulphureus 93-53]KZT02489.1 HSP20-like chaperone [Laetiporus sulphureus 93-53]
MSLLPFVTEPFYSLADFDRLFDEAFSSRTGAGTVATTEPATAVTRPLRPRMDLHQDEKTNTVTATFELPGLKKEDVAIQVQNGVLTVSGESKISSDREENGYAVRERRFGKFSRSLGLPQGVKSEDVKANLENGVLTVRFPKNTPEAAAKKITIA